MSNSSIVVSYYIPLMKNLNMSWEEIKNTPRHELHGLLMGLQEYETLHAFDGYTPKDVAEMQKNNPDINKQYADYKQKRIKYGYVKTEVSSFTEL